MHCCKYCGTTDNLIQKTRKGRNITWNICVACKKVNATKKQPPLYNYNAKIPQCKTCGTFSDLVTCTKNGVECKWSWCRSCKGKYTSEKMKLDWKKGKRNPTKMVLGGMNTRFKKGDAPINKGKNKANFESLFRNSTTQRRNYENGKQSWIKLVKKDDPRYLNLIKPKKSRKGTHLNDQQKHNCSIGQRKRWANTSIEKRFSSSIESRLEEFLIGEHIHYYRQYLISDISHAYFCDFYLPEFNIVIECDGDYWHNYPFGNDIDHIRNHELINKGYVVLRYWEHEINDKTFEFGIHNIRYYKNSNLCRFRYHTKEECDSFC